ncbi:PREDICTED: uncharacterized protein LOC104698855 [Camelina sativa]|uniref:Uncharacterized protein LOC104698855 n=1 Tax=Camelina sativa TaxID=90675 RepID=A0ABM0SKN4_CAMSA|nr:PREDICTED: uncharacterized protein LOC104698855 [Camelina sativa]
MAEHSQVDDHLFVTSGMQDFQDMTNYYSVSDMVYHGPLFTWYNKREHDLILTKLDRVLINYAWTRFFPQSYSVSEAGGCSDHLHCRVLLKADTSGSTSRKPFKFINALTEMEEFYPLVDEYWQATQPLFLSTSTLFRFSKKLKGLKPSLRRLAKDRFGSLVKRVKEAYSTLCTGQKATLDNPSVQAMADENAVSNKNNKIFHRAVTNRQSINTIKEVVCPDGRIAVTEDAFKTEAERHFREFLQLVPSDFEESRHTRTVTGVEIKKVLFSMPNDKSPGPYGFTAEFYKAAWGLIGAEFFLAVQSFFAKGFLPIGINSTILALIPKKTAVKEMKDYRPISCCNIFYKVISKILANRLKLVLPKFISGNQSAFVQDRLLIENVLLATELVRDYHKESVSGRCAIKIDISKAFDLVQWSFLSKVLTAMCCPPTFVQWIMLCVTTASFSVQVKGDLVGYFRSSLGLRQGCSLSPYMFVICMEVLTKLLDKAAGACRFGYHLCCKNLGLTHLSFADDLMVLSDRKERSVEGIVAVFDEFAKLRFPIRYLGLPLITKKLTNADLAPLLEKLRQRIGSWTLVWRLASQGNSLWVRWVHMNQLQNQSFWSVSDTMTRRSWIWRKLLKYRDVAKPLCRMVVGNGAKTSFWYDNWSPMNRLMDIGGDRGVIDLGISKQSTLAEVWDTHRRRRHRLPHINDMEDALHTQRLQRRDVPDSLHWKSKNDMFRSGFSTRDTWNHIRTTSNVVAWHKEVWFDHAVPKYSFCVWLAALNKLSIGDHMLCWNRDADGTCVLCHSALETRNHLFFSCHYATEVWGALAKGLFRTQYMTDWETNLTSISNQQQPRVEDFLRRCVFQVVVYTLWREHNGRQHGEVSTPFHCLINWADKQIKAQITAIGKLGDRRYDEAY